jgi:thiol-disulfide isomerase/thioredoxin
MKKLSALTCLCILGWFINQPGDMPQAQLDQYAQAQLLKPSVDVGGPCQQDKCLIVYVAPWCPSCKSLTPMINDLFGDLTAEGISTSIVIGKDSMTKVLAYSREYTSSILVDASGDYFRKIGAEGVPYFAVTNRAGKRINTMSGGYRSVREMRAQLDI